MKPKSALRSFLLLAGSSLLAISYSQATPLYWDVNGTTAGFSTVVGGWDGSNAFWNSDATGGAGGSTTATTANTDDLNIVSATTNTGTITVTGTQVASSISHASGVGSVTISGGTGLTIGGTGSLSGIFKSSASAQTISTPITLNTASTFSNTAAGNLTLGAVNLNGNALTFGGSGDTSFEGSAASVISGAGGIVKNGSGNLILDGAAPNAIHTFTGGIAISGGGRVGAQTAGNLTGRGNVSINGGYLGARFGTNLTFAGGLGTGATAIQILGGTSGFSGEGNTGSTFTIGTAGSVLKWGTSLEYSATGFFNPSVLLLNGTQSMNSNGKGTLANGIDLNGTNRTITSTQTTDGAASSGFTVSGTIVNTAPSTTAGFEKTGPGNLILSNTGNSYNGTTTISGGWITAASSGSIGDGSATNTLIFNGGILRATGTITSPAARGVTLTSTGIIDNNGQAVSIAGDITGAGGLTKNGTGTLTLSGTNNYGGITTVNTGTLAIAKEASLYNGIPASWTAANINVKSGATFAVNVDSAGSAGFTSANLTTLLANISVASNAAQGLQAGATLGIDTSTATGGTFTLGSAIGDSTGASGGAINLNKLGAGTLVLDQANTYTGNTIISAGTIQYTDGVAAPTTPIVNNSAFTSNATGALVQGTNFGLISGTGTVAQTSAGTLTLNLANTYTGTTSATAGTIILSNALAIQNSALNTTGAGFVTLSGVTTPTFGGLSNSGTTRDLATVISSGYGSVTNLTLNPQSGSVTYDGVIADGAAGMSLTKTGAGTQVLTGIQTYTGATNLNVGTLTLSGAGSILSSAITLNGGGLTLTNTAAETGSGRVSDSSVVTSNGGTLTYTNTSGANVYAETIGSVDLIKGQTNLVLSTDQVGAGSQTLTINTGGITRTPAATNTSAITFSAAGAGLNATKNRILVTGATATPAGGIIAPWATLGTAANVQTAFAAYDASGYVVAAVPTVAAADTDLASASGNYDINTGSLYTLTGTRTVNAVQFRGAASTLDLATFKLETNGFFFNGGAGNGKTITAGTGGALTTPSGGGNLYITAGQVMTSGNEHKITAPITDNGGAVNLVKSGTGILILNGTNYTYTGNTIINAGTLQFGVGTSGGTLTQINGGTYAGNIFIARGAALSLQGSASNTLSGVISGDGNLNLNRGTTTLSGANTYTGKTSMSLVATNSVGSTINVSSFNSVNGGTPLLPSSSLGCPTTVANGTIDFGGGGIQQSAQINYTGAGETTDRIINFQFNGNNVGRIIDASGSGLLKFTSPFTSNGSTGNNIVLQGTGSGEIVQGLPFTFTNFTKSGSGTWTLGGPLRNIGTNAISGGTLVISGPVSTTGLTTVSQNGTLILSGNNSSMAAGITLSTNTSVVPKLHINSATALGTGTLTFGGGGASDTVQIDNSSAGAVTVSTANAIALNRNFTFVGTQSLNLGTGTATIGGLTTGTNRNINVTANTLTFGGAIAESVANVGINKQGAGTLVLAGAGSSYNGGTVVTAGTLAMGANDVLPDTTNVSIGNGTLNAATFDDTAGTLDVTDAASTINLGSGATLAFADSEAVDWTGGTLNITGTFVSGSSLRFGTDNTGLTAGQLLQISATGFSNFQLDASGYLTADSGGGAPEIDVNQGGDIASGGSKAFGTVTIGSNTSLVFTINNTGSAALNLTGVPDLVAISGANAGDFTVTATPTTPVAASGNTTFTVQFAPSGSGVRNALLTIANNDSDEGTFTINVSGTGQTQYEAWASGAAFNADANGDGVKNGLAFLLGAANPNASALGLLPTVSHSGGNLTLTFNMLNAANRGSATLNVEHSSNLGISDPWTAVTVPDTTPGGPTSGVTFTIAPGSPTNNVTATISNSEAASGKLFGRLKANP